MKKTILRSLPVAVAMILGASVISCTQEQSFAPEAEGILKMRMVLNSDVTRAEVDQAALAESCVVYISNSKGLIRKFIGLDEMPSELVLRSGNYVAEAWAGDSVTASFDKKFYRGYQPFEITTGVTNVTVNCRIANVVVSVNSETINAELLSNYTIEVGNTRGSLTFDEENINSAVGYFMQPNGDSDLQWTLSGKDATGAQFEKKGVIEGVESAHHYVLNLKYGNEDYPEMGGMAITIEVDDTEVVIEDEVVVHSSPKIMGVGFDISKPIATSEGQFEDMFISTAGFGAYEKYKFDFSNASAFGLQYDSYDLKAATAPALAALWEAGMEWNETVADGVTNSRIILRKEMLNRLTEGEYSIRITILTDEGIKGSGEIRFIISDDALQPEAMTQDNLRSYSATINLIALRDSENPGVEYRKKGDTEWIRVNAEPVTRAEGLVVKLTNLSPATEYEYRSVCDGWTEPRTYSFTTDPVFRIPNASFEDWSNASNNAIVPSLSGKAEFWDSGNHGSIKLNKNVTQQSTDIKHSGNSSAKLESQFVGRGSLGKFAAGNIFAGTFDGMDGMDGVLTFGRPFDGSHPVKLRGWAHYRPGKVQKAEVKAGSPLQEGDNDNGQIFVALATNSQEIRTKSSNQKLFNENDPSILAYGTIIWTENFAPDGQMQEFEIEIVPKSDSYYTTKPSVVIITASASRYGDFFSGGRSSTLYIDDLEFVYE